MVLRREIAIDQALVDLLLEGRIEAEIIGKKENERLTSRNFLFGIWPPDEEPNQTAFEMAA